MGIIHRIIADGQPVRSRLIIAVTLGIPDGRKVKALARAAEPAGSNRVTSGVVAGKEKEHSVITRVPLRMNLL